MTAPAPQPGPSGTDGAAPVPAGPDSAAPSPSRRSDPFRWIIENPGPVDLIIFSLLALGCTAYTLLAWEVGLWLPFTVLMLLSASLCRIRPGLAVALIAALAMLHVLARQPVIFGDLVTFYAMFCAVAYGSRRVHIAGVLAGVAGVFVQATQWALIAAEGEYGSLSGAATAFMVLSFVGMVTIIALWALGNLQRARVRQIRLVADRAAEAERSREQRTALAVAAERARIAREMHDVVAHSLSVIIAQADGGRFIASQQPEKAADVLGTIGETGRAALADMRSLLGVLRQDEETSFGPQPGVEMLQELMGRVRAAGLDVSLDVDADLSDLPHATGTSIFRLVQESLTNVLKHAGPGAAATVRLCRQAQSLQIEIIDDGQGVDPDSDGQGHGITGMQERMAVLGGTLQAGPLPGHGFRVRATLPAPPRPDLPASASPRPQGPGPMRSAPGSPAAPAPQSPPIPHSSERTRP